MFFTFVKEKLFFQVNIAFLISLPDFNRLI